MEDLLQCRACQELKAPSEFYMRKGEPFLSRCKSCKKSYNAEYGEKNKDKKREYNQEYYYGNHERLLDARQDWRDNNRDTISLQNRASHLMRCYGITVEQYEELLAKQGGRCRLCGTDSPAPNKNFSVDHDHTCCPDALTCGGCLRGLLCLRCNFVVGYIETHLSLPAINDYVGGRCV